MKFVRVELKNGGILLWHLGKRGDILEDQIRRIIKTGKYHQGRLLISVGDRRGIGRFEAVRVPADEIQKLSIVEITQNPLILYPE